MFTIYKVTNIKNGKSYVGQTTQNIYHRLNEHSHTKGSPLYGPIIEYGLENFKIEPIDTAISREEAFRKESYWILHLKCLNPAFGYNRTVTGQPLISKRATVKKPKLKDDEVLTMKIVKVEPLRTFREIEEMKEALYELGGKRDRFLFTFGINTGLRISDIVLLKVGQIRGKSYCDIHEKKTGKKRRLHLIAIQPDILEYTDGMADDDYLFPSAKGGHISTTQAYRILVRAGDWIGRNDIGTHSMRKTFGLHYYRKTKDVATLMEIFNHSAPSVTKRYIGIRDEEIAESLKDFRL